MPLTFTRKTRSKSASDVVSIVPMWDIVDQDVHRAVANHRVENGFYASVIGDIAPIGARAATGALDLAGHRLRRRDIDVQNANGSAGLGKAFGDTPAYAAAATGHDCIPAVQSKRIHCVRLTSVSSRVVPIGRKIIVTIRALLGSSVISTCDCPIAYNKQNF
jgi:hypothetical protein